MQFLQATLLLPVLRQIVDRCLQATETLLKYSPADARSNYVNTDVCGWIVRFSPLVSPGADDGLTFRFRIHGGLPGIGVVCKLL